jgi:opacity protein-like surface antigen
MRTLIAVALSTTLLASAAFAADSAGSLPAGKPAGVKQAQDFNTASWVLVGVGVVAAVAIGVASSSNGSPVGQQNQLAVTATTI